MPMLLTAPLLRWLSRLGHPRLFAITAVLFVVNLLLPDPILFVDELLLGLGTLLLANWKRGGGDHDGTLDGDAGRR